MLGRCSGGDPRILGDRWPVVAPARKAAREGIRAVHLMKTILAAAAGAAALLGALSAEAADKVVVGYQTDACLPRSPSPTANSTRRPV